MLTLASIFLKNCFLKYQALGGHRFELFILGFDFSCVLVDFGKIEGFSSELISNSDDWFYSQRVYNLRLVEYVMSS